MQRLVDGRVDGTRDSNVRLVHTKVPQYPLQAWRLDVADDSTEQWIKAKVAPGPVHVRLKLDMLAGAAHRGLLLADERVLADVQVCFSQSGVCKP